MAKRILPQVEQEVNCADEHCGEPAFRRKLCLKHFVEEDTAAWDDQDVEREKALEGVGYVFGDHALDGAWFGDSVVEVLA